MREETVTNSEGEKAIIAQQKLGKALDRLREVLSKPLDENDMVRDSAIQRFEFVIEMYKQTLECFLIEKGITPTTLKQTFRIACQVGWLEDEKLWLRIADDRIKAFSYSYNEDIAQEIYVHLHSYYPALEQTYTQLVEVR